MNRPIAPWALRALTLIGAVLVGSMFFNWVHVLGHTAIGLSLAWDGNPWLFLVPVAGALLVATSAARSPYTRIAAMFAGAVVVGDVIFGVARSALHSGADSWLLFGGAGALLAGADKDRAALRLAGGAAVVAGFFAPWTDWSMWKMLTSSHIDMVASAGIAVRALWVIPLVGVASIAAATRPHGGKVAVGSGVAVFGAFLWVMASAAKALFGVGAWVALGASAAALALGVLAPSGVPVVAKEPPAEKA